jgi:hypothetical protein
LRYSQKYPYATFGALIGADQSDRGKLYSQYVSEPGSLKVKPVKNALLKVLVVFVEWIGNE